jgi:hypothetical protein
MRYPSGSKRTASSKWPGNQKIQPQCRRNLRQINRVACEALEERRLMTLTIQVEAAGGGTSATVTSVGQVINLEVIAKITDPNGTPSQDGLQDVNGDFLSTAVDGHAIDGNLAAANVAPFTANGSAPGTQQALPGSNGNLDVGINFVGATTTQGLFFARSGSVQGASSQAATIVGNTLEFEIATLTYTVTNLQEGGATDINFAIYNNPDDDTSSSSSAGWVEDGQTEYQAVGGVVDSGTPFVVSDAALIPAPTAVNSSFTVTRNTPTTLDELTADNIVVPVNPSATVIETAPAHGTAVPITSGSTAGQILYTPTAGYTGPDSFTYKVTDTDGRTSNAATVSITVVLPAPPTAGPVSASGYKNNPVTVNVLSSDSTVSTATLVPGSVAVVTQPAHGSAVAQSNGTIIYTPTTGYLGADSFTYTVGDTDQETSAPATVSITVVAPTPPTAANLAYNAFEGTPATINLLTSVNASAGSIAPATIAIVSAPTDGTAVPQADGSVLYTPTAGYTGADSFQYTIDDTLGDVSNVATVSITVTHAPPPVGTAVVAPVVSGTTGSIIVLSNVSSGAPLIDSSVAVVTSPTHGTASVNASTGNISYTPAAGFVGTDSFTYTVEDVNLDTSTPATVSVNVGALISATKGDAHSLSFTNSAGGAETITLNKGNAEVFFEGGTGTLSIAKNGKGTVTGAGLSVSGITLTGTTKASSLSIKGLAKDPLAVPGITDASPIGSIVAPNTVLSGTVTLASATSLTFGSISGAAITIAGTSGKYSLTAGNVTNSTLSSPGAISTLRVASWTNSNDSTGLTVPSIGSLIVAGNFDAALNIGASAKTVSLASAKIGGALGGSITNSAGTIGTLSAGSVASTWNASLGSISSFAVKTGGLASNVTANSIGSLVINGGLTGTVDTTSARTIRVVGSIANTTLTLSTGSTLSVTGAITGSTISSKGGIASISAGSITGSTITSGTTASNLSLSTATASNLGSSTIGSIHAGSFASSEIFAGKVTSASLGTVTNNNGGTSFGIATDTIGSFAGVFASVPAHFGHAQLLNEEVLQAYVTQQGIQFVDFSLQIEG